MSYRGYMILEQQMDGKTVQREHFRFHIGDDWSEGETYAHFCGKHDCLVDADRAIIDKSLDGLTDIVWDSEEDAERHYKTYGDQIWTVTWNRDGNYVRIVIEGRDGSGEVIFKRVTTKYVG